jgi:DNA-binding LacI/PurR family transcriptional regulator
MKITLQHIADICKLSRGTVSLALRDDPRINERTRKKIHKIAEEMEYEPNLIAASLRNNKSNMIWIITESLRDIYDREVVRHVSNILSQTEYDTVAAFHMEDVNRYTRLTTKLFQGISDGAIIIPRRLGEDFQILRKLALRNYPVVLLDVDVEGLGLPLVTSDNEGAAKELIEKCQQRGYKHFVLLQHLANPVAKLRKTAALKSISGTGKWIEGKEMTEKWLKSTAGEPIAVFADSQNDIVEFLKDWRNSLTGRDLLFACFDEWYGDPAPAKTVLVSVQDYEGIAKQASEMLLNILRSNQSETKTGRLLKVMARKEIKVIQSDIVL